MKKFKKNIKTMATVAMAAVTLVSCNYLDIVPPATPDFKDTMKDRDATLGFLYSCYAGLRSWANSKPESYLSASDEFVEPMEYGYAFSYYNFNQVTPTEHNDLGPWVNIYNNLGQCHLFTKYLPVLNPEQVTEEDRTRWMAEIKFLEAIYHNILLDAYGPIPLVTGYIPQNTAKTGFPGRSPYDACVDSISKWYDEAAQTLPATVSTEELGRGTSTACYALKAKLLVHAASPLWNGHFPYPTWKNKDGKLLVSNTYDASKWQRALEACNKAIEYATTTGQRSLFDMKTSESLRKLDKLPLPTYEGEDTTFSKHVMQMRYLTTSTEEEGNHEVIFGVVVDADAHIRTGMPHGCLVKNDGNAIGGWAGLSPTLNAIESFYTKDGKLPKDDPNFYNESEWFESAGIKGKERIIKLNAYREPRFYAWVTFDGDEYSQVISNGKPLVCNYLKSDKAYQGYNPTLYQRDNSQTGFNMKKNVQPNFKWTGTGSNNMRIVPQTVIRLADLYLLRAECYANLGQTDKAIGDLNIIRERAGVPDLTAADVTSEHPIVEWVHNERFSELFFEGERAQDLRRWMLAPQYLGANVRKGLNALSKADPSFAEFNTPKKIDQPFQWSNRMYLIPVAVSEVYSNPQLVQAPGY